MVRGNGGGSVSFDQAKRLWVGRIDLPVHEYDKNGNPIRRRKVIRRRNKDDLLAEMASVHAILRKNGDTSTANEKLDTWMTYWLREVASKSRRPATMASYRSVVAKNIVPHLGNIALDKIRPTHIRKMLATLEANGAAPTTLRNTFSILSAALKDAERDSRLARNPCELVEAPRKGRAKLEVLEKSEIGRVLESLRGTPDFYLWATFMLTGARRGEVLGLQWDRIYEDGIDLSWQLQRLTYTHGCAPEVRYRETAPCGFKRAGSCPQRKLDAPKDYEYESVHGGLFLTRPKSAAGWRIIPLVEPLKGWLEEWRQQAPANPHGFLFTIDGRPIDPNSASKIWPETRRALGVARNVRLHDLRHGAIDMMYEAEVPEADIIRIFGHSTVQMSRSYRSAGNRAREAVAMQRTYEALGLTSA